MECEPERLQSSNDVAVAKPRERAHQKETIRG
jgi:hypothetical protein